MSWVRRLLAAALIVIGASALGAVPVLAAGSGSTPATTASTSTSYCELAFDGNKIPYTIVAASKCTGASETTEGSVDYEAVHGCIVYEGTSTPVDNPNLLTCTQEMTKLSAGGGIPSDLPTVTSAVLKSLTTSKSGSSGLSTTIGSGTVPADTCSMLLNVTQEGQDSSGNYRFGLSLVNATPCASPTQKQCTVTLGVGGPTKTWQGMDCAGSGLIWTDIINWANHVLSSSNNCNLNSSVTSVITCSVGRFFSDLTNPDQAITDVLGFILGMFSAAPIFVGQLFTGALFTGKGADSMESMYKLMVGVGFAVLGFSAAFRILRSIHDVRMNGSPPQVLMDVVIRTLVALGLMVKGWAIIEALIWISSTAASEIGTGMATNAAAGVSPIGIFTTVLSSAVIVEVVSVGGILAAIPIIALIILMLYLTLIMIGVSVLLLFTAVLAPIFIPTAVFDIRNRFVQWWFAMFTGALLAPIVVTLGLGITMKAVTVMLTDTLPGWGMLLAIIFACGGIYFTGRMVSELLKGTFKHGSIMELGAAVAGMAVGAAAFGTGFAGAAAASGAGAGGAGAAGAGAVGSGGLVQGLQHAAHHYAGTRPGDFAGLRHFASRQTTSSLPPPTGTAGSVFSGLPQNQQSMYSMMDPGQAEQHLLQDDQSRQIIHSATRMNVPANTPSVERLDYMKTHSEYAPVMAQIFDRGDYYASAMSGQIRDNSSEIFKLSHDDFTSIRTQASAVGASLAARGANR